MPRPRRTPIKLCERCRREIPRTSIRYCSRACYHTARLQSAHDRFWPKVNKDGPIHPVLKTACWEWDASANDGHGYGAFWMVGHGATKTHRVAWMLTHGPIPDGLNVCHRCDNRQCVRPDHLFIGTLADNNRDMADKGRRRQRFGEAHSRAKLTEESVRLIRHERQEKHTTYPELARRFGVTVGAIQHVVQRLNWKHID